MISVLWPFIAAIALILIVGYFAWPKSDVLDLAPNPGRKPVVVLVALIGLGALGAVGYYGQHAVECMGYEEDYLNSVSQIKGSTYANALIGKGEAATALAGIKERAMQDAERTLTKVYSECGARAGDSAGRKATEMLLS